MTGHGLGESPRTPEELVEGFLHGTVNNNHKSEPDA
jgi:hypothetical protein